MLPIAESIEYRSVKGEEEIKLPKNEIEDELKKESEELKSKLDVLGLKLVEVSYLYFLDLFY